MTLYVLTAELSAAGRRLDAYLSESLGGYSRSYLQRRIADGKVLVDGIPAKKSLRLEGGEEIRAEIPEPQPLKIEPENIPLEILFEDEDVLVVNKPKGMVVHPAPGHWDGTLVNALMYHCGDRLSGINGVLRPGIVHRIDRDTTGLLVVCKNDAAHRSLAAQLMAHTTLRRYEAIAQGVFQEDEGTVAEPIGRDKTNRLRMAVDEQSGKPAVTHYLVRECFAKAALLECRLETGRTHQIRVHMAYIGHPLLGDTLYGGKAVRGCEGQCLHAGTLGFVHPRTGKYMEFHSPLPAYMRELAEKLRKE